jgi:hypothetical protein
MKVSKIDNDKAHLPLWSASEIAVRCIALFGAISPEWVRRSKLFSNRLVFYL